MKKMLLMTGMVLLAACGRSRPRDTVESLVAHPDRLREVEQHCIDNFAKTGAAACNAASEARHRLFMGNGKPAYTPLNKPPTF